MVTVLGVLGVLAVLFGAAVVATRPDVALMPASPDHADLPDDDGPIKAADLVDLRFAMVLRGYRMSQVDEVLDRAAQALRDRDAQVLELAAELERLRSADRSEPLAPSAPVVVPGPAAQDDSLARPDPVAPYGSPGPVGPDVARPTG